MSRQTLTAVARLCVTCCTAVPLQRYCMLSGAALAALGALAAVLSPLAASACFAAGTVLVAAGLLPVGWVFRELSMRRAHALMPFFRMRMLAALLIVAAIPSIGGALAAAALPGGPPLLPAVVYPALWMSGMIWVLFFAPASLLAPVLFLAALHLLRRADARAVEAFLAGPGALLCGAVLLAAWCAFALWYLGVGQIGPFRDPLSALGDSARRRKRVLPEVVSPARALHVHLWQRFSLGSASPFAAVAAGIVLGAAVALLIDARPLPMLGAPLLAAMMFTFLPGKEATYRARLVWLKMPLSRRELFAAAEKGLFRLCAQLAAVIAAMLGTAMALRGVSVGALMQVLAVAASTAVLGGYLGLMSLRAARLPDVLIRAGYVLSFALAAWIVAAERTDDPRLLWIVAAQGSAALLCRTIAMRRWAGIDWLETRAPVRDRMQDAFTAVHAGR